MSKPRVGLLPFYLELYDRVVPDVRPRIDGFYTTIALELEKREVDVVKTPVCRLKPEFEAAVKEFEQAGVDAIVTLHLAYSPSLEAVDALAGTKLPIIVLDTTPTYSYAPDQDPDELMYNHGIHGVQDMCNMLIRRGKPFEIEAGHWENSDVLDKVAEWALAARIASRMRNARIGLIGSQFKGMGDFQVDLDVLRSTIGVETVQADYAELQSLLPSADDQDVKDEMADDLERFTKGEVDLSSHIDTTRVGLAVGRWMEQENLNGFTVNFDVVDRSTGLPTVPFLEASKAMARGLGYAGEGDVLTAALVGALASIYPHTSFTEMFCPDWENDRVFVSHMGEMNVDLCDEKPVLMTKPMPWLDTGAPTLAVGRFREGDAVFVDLAPGRDNLFTLIVVPITIQSDNGRDRMTDAIRGWFQPPMPVAEFLAEYSMVGGTHHAALVYGAVADEIVKFGELMRWNVVLLG